MHYTVGIVVVSRGKTDGKSDDKHAKKQQI